MTCSYFQLGDFTVWICDPDASLHRTMIYLCEQEEKQRELDLDLEREQELAWEVEPEVIPFLVISDWDTYHDFDSVDTGFFDDTSSLLQQ